MCLPPRAITIYFAQWGSLFSRGLQFSFTLTNFTRLCALRSSIWHRTACFIAHLRAEAGYIWPVGVLGVPCVNAAGWVWRRSVLRTNIIVERPCHALRLAHSLGVCWSVEQPSSSATSTQILQMYFRFLRFLARHAHTELRCYGTTLQCGQPSGPSPLKRYPFGCAVTGPRVLNRLRHSADIYK